MIALNDLHPQWSNISIARKGAILLGLPLLLQIFLLGSWFALQRDVDELAYKIAEIRETNRAATSSILFAAAAVQRLDYLNRGDAQGDPSIKPDPNQANLNAYSNDMKQAQHWANILSERWQNLPGKSEPVKQLLSTERKLDAAIYGPAEVHAQFDAERDAVNHGLFTLGSQIPPVEDPRHKLSVQQNWLAFFLCCALLNTCLILVMVLLLSREIIGRLEHVVGNAIRLGKDRSILPAEPGNDEIARLDQAFHNMAKTISELKRRKQAIIRYSRDVLCVLDYEGRIISVSDASQRLWGYEANKLTATHIQGLAMAEDRQILSDRIRLACKEQNESTAGPNVAFEIRILRSDGSIAENMVSLNCSRSDSTLTVVAHDISEHKAAQRFRQELLQMVSHDLRNPLTSINGFHVMLESNIFGSLNTEAQDELVQAANSTKHMLELINDLLDLEKIKAGMLEIEQKKIALARVFDESLQIVQSEAELKSVGISMKNTDLSVIGDRHRLVQIIGNLLRYAVKVSSANGAIDIFAEINTTTTEVEISIIAANSSTPLEGCKIFEDNFQHIGSAQNHDSNGQDCSLMLALTRALAEMHGGKVGVESNVTSQSDGTNIVHRFWFRVPLFV